MTRQISCPTCQKQIHWDENYPWRPFCSERCKLIDLGEWANENHRIPGPPQEISIDEDESFLN